MKKTYQGSCHCKTVRFEADIDLAVGSNPDLMDGTRRCNCSFCFKARFWKCFLMPDEFRVLAGEEGMGDYRARRSNWPEGNIHHRFCATCGMRPFSRGFLEQFGGWFVCLNLAALDDVPAEALAAVPVKFEDGLHDRYDDPPSVTNHL